MPGMVYLKYLLYNLPDALPIGDPDAFPFISFTPDQEQLKGLMAAIVGVFKDAFGWQDAGDLACKCDQAPGFI